MPSPQVAPAAVFPLRVLAWSLGLFGLLRSPWVEERLVLPLTRFQQGAAEFYAGGPSAPISVTAECSGADVLALCLGAILAWPASGRSRLLGVLGGVALILTLNTARIATLGWAAASPSLFNTLHLQVWPAILALATAGYVFMWMRRVKTAEARANPDISRERPDSSAFSRRFVALSALCLVAFAFCGPWIAHSQTLTAAGAWVAGESALLLGALGIVATASGPILNTARGAFMVTPECLATVLIPLYVAGVLAAPLTWPRRFVALVAVPPVFAMLAIARVLLLALPPFITSSPLFLVHGFHQALLALAVVVLLAGHGEPAGRHRWFRAARRALVAVALAAAFALVGGTAWNHLLSSLSGVLLPGDSRSLSDLAGTDEAQGALATLFVFQTSFLLAIGTSMVTTWERRLKALIALFFTQTLTLVMILEFADRSGVIPHALLLRGWAIGLPLALALAMLRPRPPVESRLLTLVPDGPA